ncbi:MAG: hypothetical protein AB4058_20795 [Microcystaceae cyanobacterium]
MEILASEVLGASRFDQCTISMALVHLCNQASELGQEMQQRYNSWKAESDEAINDPWQDLHQFSIFIPHPEQAYEGITLDQGLTMGYNIEVEPVKDAAKIPYKIPEGGHFVIIFKQKRLEAPFEIAGTGIFIRPLAAFLLNIVVDPDEGKYEQMIIQHPIVRDYPENWQDKLNSFLNHEIVWQELPNVVGYVDQATNTDYRSPSWQELSLASQGLAGF